MGRQSVYEILGRHAIDNPLSPLERAVFAHAVQHMLELEYGSDPNKQMGMRGEDD